MIDIKNTTGNSFASAVLQGVADLAKAQGDSAKIKYGDAHPDEKGSIILDLTIGVASGAAWDLIYASVQRFRNRNDYDPSVKITVGEEEVTIEYVERGGDH